MIEKSKFTGVALAAAAASLFIAGCASEHNAPAQTADSSSVKVKCYGANSCKGQAECKTGMNSCKGQNSCKGHGYVTMSEKSCLDHFGRT